MLKGLTRATAALLGSVSYQPPTWFSALNSWRQARPLLSLVLTLFFITSIVLSSIWLNDYITRPAEPLVYATAKLDQRQTSSISSNDDQPILFIHFSQPDLVHNGIEHVSRDDGSVLPVSSLQIKSNDVPIAAIDMLDKAVNQYIEMSPFIKGNWMWDNNHVLRFKPSEPWPAGQSFAVTFNQRLFNAGIRLADDELDFKTRDLEVAIEQFTFYQDPINTEIKSLIAKVSSNYLLDEDMLAKAFTLLKQNDALTNKLDVQNIPKLEYEVEKPADSEHYFIKSDIDSLPSQEQYATLFLDAPLTAIAGGASYQHELKAQTIIPDIYSFLDIVNVSSKIINDINGNPTQTISIEFTDAIARSALNEKLSLYALPTKDNEGRIHQWNSPAQVSKSLLTNNNLLDYQLLNEHLDSSTEHILRVDLPDTSNVLLRIDGGLTSVNAYIKTRIFDSIVRLPAYPQQVFFAHEGSVLNSSFAPKVGLGSRGLDALSIEIGRIPMHQVVHLVTQTRGDITNLDFQTWQFDEKNLAHFSKHIIPLQKRSPNIVNKAAVDLVDYIEDASTGLFIIKAKGYDQQKKRTLYGIEDKKLVMLSDIALLVKHEANQKLKVFAHSLSSSQPVAGAEVSILMPNGESLISANTNQSGMASFSVPRNLLSGEYPSVVMAKKAGDFTFIPFDNYSDQIDYSRMDSGGVSAHWGGDNKLSSYLFSDRGIYRPGESVKLAAIVKKNMLASANKLNLKWVVRNPNYEVVYERHIEVNELNKGFIEAEFLAESSAPIGSYSASLHVNPSTNLGGGSRLGRQIGSTQFTISAFEPDTLSLKAHIKESVPDVDIGLSTWVTSSDISTEVNVSNLFGTPAIGNRIEGTVAVQEAYFVSKKFSDFTFYVPNGEAIEHIEKQRSLASTVTDQSGLAEFYFEGFKDQLNAGLYRLNFNYKAYEIGSGKFVDTTTSVLYSPLDALIAYKADFNPTFLKQNQQVSLSLLNLSNQHQLIARQNLTLEVMQQKSVMALVKQPDGSLRYQQDMQLVPISKRDFSLPDNLYSLPLSTTDIGRFKLQVTDDSGLMVFEFEYKVLGESDKSTGGTESNQLTLGLNKQDAKAGEILELSIEAPYTGSGLITIEKDKVEHYQWFTTNSRSSLHQIEIPKHLEGNAYVNVAFIRDPSSQSIAYSPFSYGLINFTIDKTRRILKTSLQTEPIINPDKTNTISVLLDKAAKLLVFAVDEGILQVANYQTPDPLAYFLRKQALGVRTHQMLDMLLPDIQLTNYSKAPGGAVMAEMRMRSADLQRESKSVNPFARDTLDPVVYWSSIIDAKAGQNEIEVKLPGDFNGRVRFFAVSVSDDALGSASASSLVRSSFLLSASLPTHMSPNDYIKSRLRIQALEGLETTDTPVHVKIESSPQISVLSETSFSFVPDSTNETRFDLSLKGNDNVGPAFIDITARALGENGKSISSRVRYTISNRPLAQPLKVLKFGVVGTASTLTLPYHLRPEFANQSLTLGVTASALIKQIEKAIVDIDGAENLSNSKRLTQLNALILRDNFNEKQNESYKSLTAELFRSQATNGGFPYWSENNEVDIELSLNVFEFLIAARNQQLIIDNRLFDRSLNFVTRLANTKTSASSVQRAHAIYLLTLSGVVSTNYLLDLEQDIKSLSLNIDIENQILAYRAASYSLMLQEQMAQSLVGQIDWLQHNNTDYLGSYLRILKTLSRHFGANIQSKLNEHLVNLYPVINKGVSPRYLVKIMQILSRGTEPDPESVVIDITAGHHDSKEALSIYSQRINGTKRIDIPTDVEHLNIEVTSNVYYLLEQTGYEKSPSAVQNNIELSKALFDSDGELLNVDANKHFNVEFGSDITVKVHARLKSNQQLNELMLVDLIPSGFAIVPNSLVFNSQLRRWPRFKADLEEDRLDLMTRLDTNGIEFSYQIRPQNLGLVALPSLSITHPQRLDVFAQTAGEYLIKIHPQSGGTAD